jgi:NAD(P)H dehydrogenase (quinone)
MIVVTGATGRLGRLVIEALLEEVPAERVVAAVRSPEKAEDLAAGACRCARPTTPRLRPPC